jgi:hypothetical protein
VLFRKMIPHARKNCCLSSGPFRLFKTPKLHMEAPNMMRDHRCEAVE